MKFTPERRKIILKALENGLPRKDAARRSGVSDRSLALWLERGGEDLDDGRRTKYGRFAEQVWEAEARWREGMWSEAVEKALKHPDPLKILNILARRAPDLYAEPGARSKEQEDKQRGGPIAQVLKQIANERLKEQL